MQPLSAHKSDLLFLNYLFNLKCNHPIVHFREKEMQNQRHEVCLKYIGSSSGASSQPSLRFKRHSLYDALGMVEYWNNGVVH